MPGSYASEQTENKPAQLNKDLIETINLIGETVTENPAIADLANTYTKPTFIDQQTRDMMKDFIKGK